VRENPCKRATFDPDTPAPITPPGLARIHRAIEFARCAALLEAGCVEEAKIAWCAAVADWLTDPHVRTALCPDRKETSHPKGDAPPGGGRDPD
jgi:hypothetical protein